MPTEDARDDIQEFCQPALKFGREYHVVARNLLALGHIAKDDPRLAPDAVDPGAPVELSCRAFLAEAGRRHRDALDCIQALRGEGTGDAQRPRSPLRAAPEELRANLALGGKLLHAVAQTGDHRGLAAGALAMAFERSAVRLDRLGAPRPVAGPLVTLAARTADRAMLAERHRDYEGLVADVVAGAELDAPTSARGLWRAGHLSDRDPRRHPDEPAIAGLNWLNRGEFMDHVKGLIRSHVGRVDDTGDPVHSKAAVRADIARLPPLPDRPEAPAEAHARSARFVLLVARATERMAMHLHAADAEANREAVGALLATSVSAAMRSVNRGRLARAAGAASTDRGMALM